MVKESDRVRKEAVLGTWVGLIVVTIVMITLTYTIFGGVWQTVWMWYPIMGTGIGVIITSIFYYGRDSKKCPNCSTRMDFDVEYCKKCGTYMPSRCPECGADIQSNSAFCEKCGVPFSGNTSGSSTGKQLIKPQSSEAKANSSKGNYKYCPACGNKAESYANHCPSCGIEL
jgi:predicted amidophosphoribosyltransferase